MASWLERGHPELIEAFNNVCEKIDREIRAELRQERQLLKDASTSTTDDEPQEDQLVIIDRLEKENARLRSELAALMTDANHPFNPDSLTHPLLRSVAATDAASTMADDAKLEHSELAFLQLRFNALAGNFKKAKDALEKRNRERDEWRKLAGHLKRAIKTAEEKHGIRVLEKGDCNLHLSKPNVSQVSDDDEVLALPPLPPLRAFRAGEESSRNIESLQSTQGDPEEDEAEEDQLPPLPADCSKTQVSLKREPSSDVPIIVSERVVKKRKVRAGVPEAAKARGVKVESIDSSPIVRFEKNGFNTQESLDLDNIAQRMPTPRKRKEVDDSQQDESGDEEHSPVGPPSRPGNHPPPSCIETVRMLAAATILTPISGNRQCKSLMDEGEATPSAGKGLGRGIEALAEDGRSYEMGSMDKKQRSSHRHNPGIEGRLNSLLNTPVAENKSDISSPARLCHDSPQVGLGIPERRELPFDQQTASKQSNRRLWAEAKATPRPEVDGQETPNQVASPQKRKLAASVIRKKPLSDLRLDNFKVNPSANNGNDFAFSEVVRDKDGRASLKGCTDMHCCGKHFRALALSQRPDPPLTAAQRQEEQKLLENYLGDYSYKLATMNKEEKADLWIEAKTEELANKYGKHRHRFARMQSPPGFWNADFPSTQQMEAEKEEASKRERRAVADRHREAMRPGGRWMFRDE